MCDSSLVIFCIVAAFTSQALAVTITVKNNCGWPLWPAVQTTGGGAQVKNSGFKLNAKESEKVTVPSKWTGRVWARTQCDSPNKICVTGDCGAGNGPCNGWGGDPPVSLAEFSLGKKGQDVFYISQLEGYNTPISIVPEGGSGPRCIPAACPYFFDQKTCPDRLALRTPDGFVGCKSACAVFKSPEHCFTDDFNFHQKCGPTEFTKPFKDYCPEALSFACDTSFSNFVCSDGPNYTVNFCP